MGGPAHYTADILQQRLSFTPNRNSTTYTIHQVLKHAQKTNIYIYSEQLPEQIQTDRRKGVIKVREIIMIEVRSQLSLHHSMSFTHTPTHATQNKQKNIKSKYVHSSGIVQRNPFDEMQVLSIPW